MVDVDGMVGRLMELVKDADTAPNFGSSTEHSTTEIVLSHHLRAGEGEKDTARRHPFKGRCIEFLIASQGIVKHFLVLGKCGRIEDDKVVGESPLDACEATWILEKIESIGSIGTMTWIAWEIQFHVVIGNTDGLLRNIY